MSSRSFRMTVDRVEKIPNVTYFLVSGRCESGEAKPGDCLELVDANGERQSVLLTGIDICGSAPMMDVYLDGVAVEKVRPGHVLEG